MRYQSLMWFVPVFVDSSHSRPLTDDEAMVYLVAIVVCVVLLAVMFWLLWRADR